MDYNEIDYSQNRIPVDESWLNSTFENNHHQEHGSDGVLPPGWVEYTSDEGYPYFYHAKSNQSSWERPTFVANVDNNIAPFEPETSYDQSHESYQYNQHISNDEQGQNEYVAEETAYVSEPSSYLDSSSVQHPGLSYSVSYQAEVTVELSAVRHDSTQQSISLSDLNLNMENILEARRGQHGSLLSEPLTAVTAQEFFSPFSPFSASSHNISDNSVSFVVNDPVGNMAEAALSGGSGGGSGGDSDKRSNNESTHSLELGHSLDLLSPVSGSSNGNPDGGGIDVHSAGVGGGAGAIYDENSPLSEPRQAFRPKNPYHIDVHSFADPEGQIPPLIDTDQVTPAADTSLYKEQEQERARKAREMMLDALEISPASVPGPVFTYSTASTSRHNSSHAGPSTGLSAAAVFAGEGGGVSANVNDGVSYGPPPLHSPQQMLTAPHHHHHQPQGLQNSQGKELEHLQLEEPGQHFSMISPASLLSGESDIFRCMSDSVDSAAGGGGGGGGDSGNASANVSISASVSASWSASASLSASASAESITPHVSAKLAHTPINPLAHVTAVASAAHATCTAHVAYETGTGAAAVGLHHSSVSALASVPSSADSTIITTTSRQPHEQADVPEDNELWRETVSPTAENARRTAETAQTVETIGIGVRGAWSASAAASTVFYSRPSDTDVAALISDDSEDDEGEGSPPAVREQLDHDHHHHHQQQQQQQMYANDSSWQKQDTSPGTTEALRAPHPPNRGDIGTFSAAPFIGGDFEPNSPPNLNPHLLNPSSVQNEYIFPTQSPVRSLTASDTAGTGTAAMQQQVFSPDVSYGNIYPAHSPLPSSGVTAAPASASDSAAPVTPPTHLHHHQQYQQQLDFTSPGVDYDDVYASNSAVKREAPIAQQHHQHHQQLYPLSPGVYYGDVYPSNSAVKGESDGAGAGAGAGELASPGVYYGDVYPSNSAVKGESGGAGDAESAYPYPPTMISPAVYYENVYPPPSAAGDGEHGHGHDRVSVELFAPHNQPEYDEAQQQHNQQEQEPYDEYAWDGSGAEQQEQQQIDQQYDYHAGAPGAVTDPAESAGHSPQEGELDAHQVAWLQYEQLRDSGTLSTTVVDITSYGGGQEYLLSQQQHYQQQPYQQQPESRDGRSKYSKLRSALGANKIAKSSGTSATSAMSSAKDIKVADEYLEEDFFEALPAESAAASQERENQHWVQCVTADGDVYYYNSLTQHVQWENPFEQEDVQVSQQQEAQGEHMQNQMGQTVTHTESTRAGIAGVTTSTSRDHAQAGQAQPAAAISSSTVTSNSNTMKSAAPLTPTASSNRLTTGSSVDGDSASKSVTSKPKRGMVTHNTVAGAEPSLRPTRSITSSPASSSNTGAAAPATPLQQPQQANVHQQSSWSSAGGRNGGGGVGVPAFNTNPQYQYRTSPHAHPQQEAYKYPQHQHVQQHTQQQVLSPSQQQQVEPQYAYPNATTTTVMYQQQQVEDEAEGEGEGDGGSTVGSPMAYNRYTPLGLRTGTVSISSLSDNDNSEYGFGSSVQGSVQGAFVMHHHHSGYQPRSPNQAAIYTPSVGGAGSGESSPVASSAAAKSSAVQPRNKPPAGNIGTAAVNNTTSASPPTGPSSGPQAEPEEASQASTESQTQRHLEIWDRFFRNAMLVNQQQNQDGSGDGAGDETQLSQAAVKASIRKIRQKAALSRSKGATAVARWPHLLSQRRYNALITFALRKHPAVAASSHPSVEAAQEQELLESSSVAGSVNSIDGTLLSMALLAATLHEDVATVEALLHNGANPSCVDDLIRTPAHYACKLGNVALLALLFDHDAQLEATDAAGRTPLHTAAIFGRVTAMEFMLGCAVDCNAADLAGNTALHLAARAGFEDGCRVLLSFGASTVVRNLMGMTALGVAQIMRPQSAALQAVIAVLSNPLAEMPTDYDRRQQTSTSAQNEPVRRPAPQYGGGDGDAYIDYAGGAHGGWDEQGLYNPEYEAQEDYAQGDPYQNQHHQNHQIYKNHPEYQGQDEQQPYHYQYGSDVEGEVEGEGDGDNDGEGDGESGDEGNSVAELVASSVWGVAASLIDITLSMFMNPAAAPATATTSSSPRGGDKSAAGQQRTRSKISDDHDPDAHYSYGDGNPDAHQQRPLRPSAPAPAPYFPAESQRSSSGGGAGITRNIASAPLGAALWQMLGLGGGNQNRDSQLDGALSREQTQSTSLSGLAGGPPTDQELSERGLGFPVHRPPSIPAEMSSEPSSPPRSHNNHHSPAVTAIKTMSPPALVAREIDEHIRSTASTPQRREGYVPPSPPNEVIIAVAISKAEQQRQHVKQAAHQQQQGPPTAGISMMDERLPPSRPSSQPPLPPVLPAGVKGALTFVNPSESLLHPADGQDATVMSDTSPATSIKGRKGLHAPSGGGILKNSHTAVGAGTVSGSGAGNPSVTAGTTGAGAGSSSICSPPTSGNGYSLGASLPRGVTWRYVDVLSNQQT